MRLTFDEPEGTEHNPEKRDKEKESESIRVEIEDEFAGLRESLEKERVRADDLQKKMLYLQADFENYRKRVAVEIENRSLSATAELIVNLLGLADELGLALKTARETSAPKELTEGLGMTLAKLYKTLGRYGLRRIEAVGRPFDPRLHEAVERVPTDKSPEGTVVEEVRAGFTMGEKVIRPSVVKVSCSTISGKGERGVEMKK
jgi:molecular chaperone GrpE